MSMEESQSGNAEISADERHPVVRVMMPRPPRIVQSSVRCVLALMCSHAAAPYAVVRFTIHYQLQSDLEWKYALVGGVAMATGAVLARQQFLEQPAQRKWTFGVSGVLLWIAAVFVLLNVAVHSSIPGPVLGLLIAGGYLWVVWAVWAASFFRSTGIAAGSVLVGLAAVPFWSFVEAAGLRGNSQVEFVWRTPGNAVVHAPDSSVVTSPGNILWEGYLGARRDGIVRDVRLSEDWASHPPEPVWRQACGRGWSSFAVSETTLYGQEQLSTGDCVTARDLTNGELLWTTAEGRPGFRSGLGGDGPRATPLLCRINEGNSSRLMLFAVGPTGVLSCLEAVSGDVLWKTDLVDQFPGEELIHGVCGSPLIVDDLVVVAPPSHMGPCLAAFKISDGAIVWKCSSDWQASYASPALMTICEQRQIVLHAGPGILSVHPSTGLVLWQFEWTNEWDNNATQPLQVEHDRNDLFVATGYRGGLARISISRADSGGLQVTEAWTTRRTMKTKFSNMAQFGEVLVGLDNGILCGVDVRTGERCWKKGRYNFGQLLKIGEHLLVVEEGGHLRILKPDPKGDHLIGDGFPVLHRKTWGHPALIDDRLILRNDEQIVCLRLPFESD